MAKILKISFPEKCIGCELCVTESQRQLKVMGLEGSLIRIFRERREGEKVLTFSIQMDPQINDLNIKKIAQICPTGVFTVEESSGVHEFIR